MPITEREWDDGEFDTDENAPTTDAVGDYDTNKDLILAFLAENTVTKRQLDRDGESVDYYRLNQV